MPEGVGEDIRRKGSQRKQILFKWQTADQCLGMNGVMIEKWLLVLSVDTDRASCKKFNGTILLLVATICISDQMSSIKHLVSLF